MNIINLIIDIINSPFAFLIFFLAYTWTTKTNLVDDVDAAHVNLLQTEKLDRDGEIQLTGTFKHKVGADKPSAGTLDIGTLKDGNIFDVTGAVTITAISTIAIGTIIVLHFDSTPIITHHAADLILPGGANITTAVGDEAIFYEYDTGKWRCVTFIKASGLPIATKDEDDMASDSAVHVATQQSIKAFGDGGLAKVASGDFTRDIAGASGDVIYAGVGFMPRALIIFSADNATGSLGDDASFGLAVGTNDFVVALNAGTTDWVKQTNVFVHYGAGAQSPAAIVKTLDADGFTLTWTKTGTPTGTLQCIYLAIR